MLSLLSLKGVGRKTAISVSRRLTVGAEDHLENFREGLQEAGRGISRFRVPSLQELNSARTTASNIIQKSTELNLHVLSLYDEEFPRRLQNISDPPAVLYVKGPISVLHRPLMVAVIGTREPSEFGVGSAHRIGMRLPGMGAVVVSGLALGCDAAAHLGCVDEQGTGVAVLAHGLHTVSPASNRELAARLLDHGGCLVSEYAPGLRAQRTYFVERDRLQSGLSDAIIVIETGVKGGTMHTVNFAREQRRLVACTDHVEKYRNHPKAAGNQMLIQSGKAIGLADNIALQAFIKRVQQQTSPQPAQVMLDVPKDTQSAEEVN